MKNDKIVELDEMNIILKVPKNSKKITLEIKLDNEEASKVSRKLDKKDIKAARKSFLENVEFGDDYDCSFVITEKGKQWLEKQLKKSNQNN